MDKKERIITRYLAPALTGALLTLCQPTSYNINLAILAWFALVPLLVTLPGQRPIERFVSGSIAGGVHFLTGLYWLVYTLNTYGNMNMVGSFFVALLLVAGETAYIILFTLACGWVQEKRPSLPSALVVPVLWVTVELMRDKTPFGGFPWLLVGYSQQKFPMVIQIAEITGVYGVSFLVILVNAVIASAVIALRSRKSLPIPGLVVATLLLALTLSYGRMRIAEVSLEAAQCKPLKVSLLQGSILQNLKWSDTEEARIIGVYQKLTTDAVQKGSELIVWPEAAIPFAFERDIEGVLLANWLAELNTYTLLGSVDYTLKPNRKYKFTNSAYLVSPAGITKKYSKLHLVPFGEYIPLTRWLGDFVTKISEGASGNFNPGEDVTIFQIPQGRFGVVICYEAIFGELVRLFRNRGAELLVNITNDAWFGDSSAPRQHLSMAAFRCAENRCYLIRAANTGITAVVDPVGRIIEQTPLFAEASITTEVRMMPGSTFYSRNGDVFAWCVFLLTIVGILFELGLKVKNKFAEKRA